jgi:hypothetical protein
MSSTIVLILFLFIFIIIIVKCVAQYEPQYEPLYESQYESQYEPKPYILMSNSHPKLGNVYNNPPQPLITYATIDHILGLMGNNDGKIYIKTYAGMGNFFISKRDSLKGNISLFYESHADMHIQKMYDDIDVFTKGYKYIDTK